MAQPLSPESGFACAYFAADEAEESGGDEGGEEDEEKISARR